MSPRKRDAGGDPQQLSLEQSVRRVAQPEEPRIHTVSQIVRLAGRQLQDRFGEVWIEGEVSNLRKPASGHLYFSLKDGNAQLSAVMFRSVAQKLRFRLEDGQQLRCRGSLTIYEARGQFQLSVDRAEPAGLGDLQLAFEQLKRKLAAEGLFDDARKQSLPLLPRIVAVVTSPSGAAVRDVLRVLHDRCPVRVLIVPTAVQGKDAPAEIAAALARADGVGAEVIIVGRGGGSLEDLWAFNSEIVARALYGLRTPVISAVGHEVDVTIADFVADRRAATPTAAAEMAVPIMDDLYDQLDGLRHRLGRAQLQNTGRARLELERLKGRLGRPALLVDRARMRVDDLVAQAQMALVVRLRTARDRQQRMSARLNAANPRLRLLRYRSDLDKAQGRLRAAMSARLEVAGSRLGRHTASLQALSPLSVLARGYSLVLDEGGAVVREASATRVGARVTVRLHHGTLGCRVEDQDDAPIAEATSSRDNSPKGPGR